VPQAPGITPPTPSFTPAAPAASAAPATPADQDESGSWFSTSTRTPAREPEQDSPESLFRERRVPGQSLHTAAQAEEPASRPPRFEPPGFRDEPSADFDEPSRSTMRTRRGQPRFSDADDLNEQPFTERTEAPGQPPITQVPGFGGDSRGSREREDFGERTRFEQPSPRFYEDTDPDERTRLSQPRFTGDADPQPPAGPERTRLSQPRFEEPDGFAPRRGFPDSPRFDEEVDDRTVQRQDQGGPGYPGGSSTVRVNTPFGQDPGLGGDPGYDSPRGYDSTRGYDSPRGYDSTAAFGAGPASAAPPGGAPAGSEWNFRDTGPETGAFQGSYGGSGGNAGNSGYPVAFGDQAGSGQPGTFQNGTAARGPYTANDRGFITDTPFGQGGQPGQGSQPSERKRSRKVPVIIGAGVLVVALGAGGAVIAPKFLKHTDPGCTAYTSSALPAYNHAISDLNAQASQATLEGDLTTAVGQLTTATGQASGAEVKTALQGLLTQLKQVQADVKKGTVPDTTVTSLNTASTTADNAC
jgi:hypothetical protein